MVDHTLNCEPDEGGYKDNHAACRALAVVIDALRTPVSEVCSCPAGYGPGYRIEGRYELQDVRLRFGACALCGAPKGTGAAFSLLFSS